MGPAVHTSPHAVVVKLGVHAQARQQGWALAAEREPHVKYTEPGPAPDPRWRGH